MPYRRRTRSNAVVGYFLNRSLADGRDLPRQPTCPQTAIWEASATVDIRSPFISSCCFTIWLEEGPYTAGSQRPRESTRRRFGHASNHGSAGQSRRLRPSGPRSCLAGAILPRDCRQRCGGCKRRMIEAHSATCSLETPAPLPLGPGPGSILGLPGAAEKCGSAPEWRYRCTSRAARKNR